MTINEIVALINGCPEALEPIEDFASNLEAETVYQFGRPHDGIVDKVKSAMAESIWDVMIWTADHPVFGNTGKTKRTGRVTPSQGRQPIIDELRYFDEFFLAPKGEKRIRARQLFTNRAYAAVGKQGFMGQGALSHMCFIDPENKSEFNLNDCGLETSEPKRVGVALYDRSIFTSYASINERILERKLAHARERGGSGWLAAGSLSWELAPEVEIAFARANQDENGNFVVESLQKFLDVRARENLAECCREAAHLLEGWFGTAQSLNEQSEDNSTISSFLFSPPFHRFIARMYELLAPTRHPTHYPKWLQDTLISRSERELDREAYISVDNLKEKAKEVPFAGILCLQSIVEALKLNLDLLFGIEFLKITEYVAKRQKEEGNPDGVKEGTRADSVDDRKIKACELMIANVWDLRKSWLMIRSYTNFFDWYNNLLLREAPVNLAGDFSVCVLAPIASWSKELASRFELGLAYEHDLAHRADGRPLDIPETPEWVLKRPVKLRAYPDRGEWGAVPDRESVHSLIRAISIKSPKAREVWSRAVEFIEPFSTLAKLPVKEKTISRITS